jgi:hypothetical protein
MGAKISKEYPSLQNGGSKGGDSASRDAAQDNSEQGVPAKHERFRYGRMTFVSPDFCLPAKTILAMYISKYENWFPDDPDWNVGLEDQIRLAFKSATGTTKDDKKELPDEKSKQADVEKEKKIEDNQQHKAGDDRAEDLKSSNPQSTNAGEETKVDKKENENITYNRILREIESVAYTLQLRTSIIPVDVVLQRRLSVDESKLSQETNSRAAARATAEAEAEGNAMNIPRSKVAPAPRRPRRGSTGIRRTKESDKPKPARRRRFSATGVARLDDAFELLSTSDQEETYCRNRIKRMVEVLEAVVDDYKALHGDALCFIALTKSFKTLRTKSRKQKAGTFRASAVEDANIQAALAAALG